MSRIRSKYQVQFREVIDDPRDWRDYGGLLLSEVAAQSRAKELMIRRPTRLYRIVRLKFQVSRETIWSSQKEEKPA